MNWFFIPPIIGLSSLIFFSLPFLITSSTLPPGGVTRTNYGVDFNFLYSVNNMHGSWKHIWTMDMALMDRSIDYTLELKCEVIDPMCKPAQHFVDTMKNVARETTEWMFKQFKWAHNPEVLATLNRQGYRSTRMKRSLLPFVGDIEKFFFGTATESDINAIKTTLEDFEKMSDKTINQVTNLGENLASLSKIVNEQISNSKAGFNLVKTTFENMTQQINSRFSQMVKEMASKNEIVKYNTLAVGHTWSSLESILPQLVESMKLMISDLQLLEAVQIILQGFLPISVVPPNELEKGLRIAEEGIKSQFPSATLTYTTQALGFYYTHKIVTPYFNGDSLSLIVDIPIDLGQDLLYVYAIRTFPVSILPYNPYTRTVDPLSKAGVAQSELVMKETHFLVSQDGNFWSVAKDLDMASCVGESVKSCKHQFAMYRFNGISCIERIWNNRPFNEILEVCPYRLSHAGSHKNMNTHVQVNPLTSGRWYIEAPLGEQWTITCPSRPPEKRSSCTSCVIQVDCGCGIESSYFRIPTRVSSCDSVFSPLHKNFSVNPFNYQPKHNPWIVNLTGDDNFPSPPRSIPDIRLPDSGSWDDVIESMDSKQYDLNKLYEKQLNETKVFRTEAEALLLKIKAQDKMLESLAGWPDWILSLMLILTFGNSAIIGLACCWFFMRAHAKSIGEELEIIEGMNKEMIDLELVEFVLTCLCFVLLVVLAWPIISNWIRGNRIYRRFQGVAVKICADGYRNIRGHQKVILQGNLLFGSSKESSPRVIPARCLLASVPIGTHLGPYNGPINPIVSIVEDRYYLEFPVPIVTITPTEREVTCPGLYFAYDYVHRKCHVPMATKWTSINSCRLWIE